MPRRTDERRDAFWLVLLSKGYSITAIANAAHKSTRSIQRGIRRARGAEEVKRSLWAIEWLADSNFVIDGCAVHDHMPFEVGAAVGCLSCLQCGYDHLIGVGERLPGATRYAPADGLKGGLGHAS
jgi:hypothetical protein